MPRINPLIPADWTWGGLRALPYHGDRLTYFFVREGASGFRIYSTCAVESEWDVDIYRRDVSDDVRVFSEAAVVVALARDDGIAVLIGNTGTSTIQTPVTVDEIVESDSAWSVRTYNSERKDWEPIGRLSSAELRGFAVSIEAKGFRLIELSAE
jgi:hypothetical protein